MPHTDTYLDAMLRRLGAAYYESLHGRATGATCRGPWTPSRTSSTGKGGVPVAGEAPALHLGSAAPDARILAGLQRVPKAFVPYLT
jgi:hypothetical protein